jgi:hypothetical protein
MKKKIITILVLFVFALTVNAQVGIGIAAPDGSAMLDVTSTTKGLLAPRMTAVQRAAIGTPATGLVVYQTDATAGFYYNAGTPGSPSWVQLFPADGTLPIANGGTGQTTASGAINALVPTQTGNSGKYLSTDGSSVSWAATGGGGGLSEYAYIYNLSAQVVPLEADIVFSDNGVINGTMTHAPGTSTISLGTTGDYTIWFNVAGVEPNQFTLFQNGAPVAGAGYGSGAGTQINSGMVIITAAAGDILTLRNHTSAAAVTLQTLAGGTQLNANVSILIHKID